MHRYYSGNPFFQLPFAFNAGPLQQEVLQAGRADYRMHFNQRDYKGHWSVLALRAPHGDPSQSATEGMAASDYAATPLLRSCPAISAVLDRFEVPMFAVRLMKLDGGSQILEHTDNCLGYEDGVFRLHIPVFTHPQVMFRVGGRQVDMQPGSCWYANFNLPHSVENKGSEPRIHLVIDAERNDWSDEVFRQCGYDFEAEARQPEQPLEELQRTIEELERQQNPAIEPLLQQLKAERDARS